MVLPISIAHSFSFHCDTLLSASTRSKLSVPRGHGNVARSQFGALADKAATNLLSAPSTCMPVFL